jgi:hypothetical protein
VSNVAARKSVSPQGTVVWKTGGGKALGQFVVPSPNDGQCPGVGPAISGGNASFTVLRNRNRTYEYNGRTRTGASTCYRNQMNPVDANTGTNFLFELGSHYTFSFQTVVSLNGNVVYQDAPDGGLAVDLPAIVWQTHSYGGPPPGSRYEGGTCDLLVIQNTYSAYLGGYKRYGSPPTPRGGLATWNFHTCDERDFSGHAYNSPDTLHDGQVDDWQIDITAQIQPRSGGSVVVRRNGKIVYDAPSHVCDGSKPECWWNFGAYMFYWENTEEPPGWNHAGVTIQVNGMTLVKR